VSDSFSVKSHKHTYSVGFVPDFTASLDTHLRDGDVLVVDAHVAELYATALTPRLAKARHIIIPPSEEKKSYQGLDSFIDELLEMGFRKNNRLIAIGGGITQDITAFAASILFRGVDWIFYPTTLLAQCDSCIGSKTSINFGKYKNQLGGFYPPTEIVIDLAFLDTLGEMDIKSGMGEMLHYYLVSGEEDFERMRDEYDRALEDKAVLQGLLHRSLEIKRRMIEVDEFDEGPRNVFNYGHSFGHAIETLTDYKVPHGVAVSFGMDIANHVSSQLGYITPELRFRMRALLEKNWAGVSLRGVRVDDLVNALRKDKKAVGNEIRVILTKGLGAMFKSPLDINDKSIAWLEECLAEYA